MTEIWMCYNPKKNGPRIEHLSKEEAEKEAERLCRLNGDRIILLQSIAVVEPTEQPVQWQPIVGV